MKVLVTGGAGYIGSHTCKLLATRGYQPIVFDNLSTGNRSLARYGAFEHGDIRDPVALYRVMSDHRPEAVIHFAASAYVGESMRIPRHYYQNNVVGTLNLLEAMVHAKIKKLVFSSSCATYGIPREVPIRETSPQTPINPYGRTKLICEQMIQDIAATELLSCVALRYFNAAGADADGELGELHEPETHAIPLILATQAGHRESFTVLGNDYDTPDGTCIRDYLHVSDLARAHLQALERLEKLTGFDAINLGTGRGYSVLELIRAAEQINGDEVATAIGPRREGDPPVLVAHAEKAASALDWAPLSSDIHTIVGSAWRWMLSPSNPLNTLAHSKATRDRVWRR